MYFLGYRWTGNRLGASVAGLVFAFNGLSLNLLMWPSHIATFSWMPWVVLTVEQGWLEGGRKIIVAAICGAFQMLAGGPETILLTWLLLSAVWVMRLRNTRMTLRKMASARSDRKLRGASRLSRLGGFDVHVEDPTPGV